MVFNTGAALLDAIGGRNRRYYKITEPGQDKLVEYRREWEDYSMKISALFSGEEL